jgi:hypothetical protein
MNKKLFISLIFAILSGSASAASFSFGISSHHNYSYQPYYYPCYYVEPCYAETCYAEHLFIEPIYVAPRRQTVIIKREPVVFHERTYSDSSYAKKKRIRKLHREIKEKERRIARLEKKQQHNRSNKELS